MSTTSHPSSCPSCGAPAGAGTICEFCGSPLLSVPIQAEPAPPVEPVLNEAVADWMQEEPHPSAPLPHREEPFVSDRMFTPPPPSGLEPISLALNEAAKSGQSMLRRILASCLSGCVISVITFVACGLVSMLIFRSSAQGDSPLPAIIIGLGSAVAFGLAATLVMFVRIK